MGKLENDLNNRIPLRVVTSPRADRGVLPPRPTSPCLRQPSRAAEHAAAAGQGHRKRRLRADQRISTPDGAALAKAETELRGLHVCNVECLAPLARALHPARCGAVSVARVAAAVGSAPLFLAVVCGGSGLAVGGHRVGHGGVSLTLALGIATLTIAFVLRLPDRDGRRRPARHGFPAGLDYPDRPAHRRVSSREPPRRGTSPEPAAAVRSASGAVEVGPGGASVRLRPPTAPFAV
jgi:hypothetical protein